MAAQVYDLFFGTANAGGAPTFVRFTRADTGAAIAPPAITERGNGLYQFGWDWSLSPAASVEYIATLNGIEVWDVISTGTIPVSAVAVQPTTNLSGFSTAGTLINRALVQLRLAVGPPGNLPDPFASTDANTQELIEILNTIGDEFNSKHDWTHFIREATITTDGVRTAFDLPSDFHEMIDQTGWNRSQRLPLVGPLSGQERQTIKAQLAGVIVNVPFSLMGSQIVFPLAPPTATIVLEYVSSYWAVSGAGTTLNADHVAAAADVVCYDPLLILRALKLQWSEAHGFDTAVLQRAFDLQLEHAIGKNKGARTLNMAGGKIADRWLDRPTTPPGNWGSS